MATKRLLLLIIIVVILGSAIVKTILFLTAEPKVTADYVAEYNAITFPANYDPNRNAASNYQKAFDAFVEMPREIMIQRISWPADYNDSDQILFQRWLASNLQAFEQFKIAANKPYYWLERKAGKDNSMMSIITPEWSPLRQLIEAVAWQAKQNAIEGQTQNAFENILDCYRAGRQKCRTPSLATEQHWGRSIEQTAMDAALVILDRAEINTTTLKFFQDILYAELAKDKYVPDLDAEKLFLYDVLQRTFVDNGKGTGRLAFRKAEAFFALCGEAYNRRVFLSCFIGPTRNEIVEQINEIFASFDSIKMKTPQQLHSYDRNYFMKLDTACENNFVLGIVMPSLHRIHKSYHQTKSDAEAVVAVLAILRYKADTGQYPESLDKLVSAGYLQSVPMDPYSDGPLVYKVTEDNFTLYSVGENFVDDGGKAYPADIIYWPVKRLERPKLPSETEEETETMQKISDANEAK